MLWVIFRYWYKILNLHSGRKKEILVLSNWINAEALAEERTAQEQEMQKIATRLLRLVFGMVGVTGIIVGVIAAAVATVEQVVAIEAAIEEEAPTGLCLEDSRCTNDMSDVMYLSYVHCYHAVHPPP